MVEGRDRADPRGDRGTHRPAQDRARWRDGRSTAWSSRRASSGSAPPSPPSKRRWPQFFERLLRRSRTRPASPTMAEAMPEPPDLAGVAAAIVEPITASFAPAETHVDDAPAVESDGSEMTDERGLRRDRRDGRDQPTAARPRPADAESGRGRRGRDRPAVRARLRRRRSRSRRVHRRRRGRRRPRSASPRLPPTHDHESAAAALAATADDSPPQGERATTRVIVLGLVSVASIATFKRSLGRVPGVSTIGVASGPDGEFVFTVSHDAGIAPGRRHRGPAGLRGSGHGGDLRRPRGRRARPRRRLLTPSPDPQGVTRGPSRDRRRPSAQRVDERLSRAARGRLRGHRGRGSA